jgi:hypothetical protein
MDCLAQRQHGLLTEALQKLVISRQFSLSTYSVLCSKLVNTLAQDRSTLQFSLGLACMGLSAALFDGGGSPALLRWRSACPGC